jgi:hypothetical protein
MCLSLVSPFNPRSRVAGNVVRDDEDVRHMWRRIRQGNLMYRAMSIPKLSVGV